MLFDLLIIMAAFAVGGIWRRSLGGGPPVPRWALFIAASAAVSLAVVAHLITVGGLADQTRAAIIVLAVTVPVVSVWTWPGHGETMDMGRASGNLGLDFIYMLGRYCIAAAIATAALYLADAPAWLLMLLGGPIPAMAYAGCWALIPGLRVGHIIDGPTSAAEIIAGGGWYAVLAATLILGGTP